MWAELTTSSGLLLTGQGSVGHFSNHGTGSGVEILLPAWPKLSG